MLEEIYPRLLSEVAPSHASVYPHEIRDMLEAYKRQDNPNRAYGKLVKSIYESNLDSNIGLNLGAYLLPSRLCDFSRMLVTAENIRNVIDLAVRFFHIQGASYMPIASCHGDKVRLCLIFPFKDQHPDYLHRFCTETAFSYLVNGIRETVSPDFKPDLVQFSYSEPNYSDEYESIFGERLEFGSHLNMIEFSSHYLNKRLPSYNPTLHQMYLNKYLDYARECERLARFEYKAVAYLVLHHPDSLSSEKLASRMNISVRGLQKRLHKSGKSFSSISNLCRRELAKVYLIQENRSIEYTAEQLGFQSSSGFRRFFKSEFNTSPAEYIEHQPDLAIA